jgi:hypothetical protein
MEPYFLGIALPSLGLSFNLEKPGQSGRFTGTVSVSSSGYPPLLVKVRMPDELPFVKPFIHP